MQEGSLFLLFIQNDAKTHERERGNEKQTEKKFLHWRHNQFKVINFSIFNNVHKTRMRGKNFADGF